MKNWLLLSQSNTHRALKYLIANSIFRLPNHLLFDLIRPDIQSSLDDFRVITTSFRTLFMCPLPTIRLL